MITPKYADYDGSLELQDVRKQNWKTAESRDHWEQSLQACRDAYPELTVRAVASNETPRQATILDVNDIGKEQLFDLATELDVEVSFDTPPTEFAVANSKSVAERALEASNEGDHEELGRLFGYPDCCIEEYSEGRLPVYEIACRTESCVIRDDEESLLVEDPDGLLNVFWQYLGWQFIDHQPCSFNCEESRELAVEHGSLYREMGLGDEAEKLWEFLSEPLTWTGYHGLSNIRNGYCIGSTNTPPYWSKKKVVWGEEHQPKKL